MAMSSPIGHTLGASSLDSICSQEHSLRERVIDSRVRLRAKRWRIDAPIPRSHEGIARIRDLEV